MKVTGNTIAITGGAGGIGLAIARALTGLGNEVAILGRDPSQLARAKQSLPSLHCYACDITDEAAIRQTFDRLVADLPGLNVLVNAAGVSRGCNFATDENAIQIARAEINTNLLGTTMVTRIALPFLIKQPESALVVISSGIVYAPHLGEATHSATKAALHALCRCLRHQLRETSVKVFEVCPPLTDTPLTASVEGKKVTPDEVAAALVKGLRRNTNEIRISLVKALYVISRLSPALAERIVTGSATAKEGAG